MLTFQIHIRISSSILTMFILKTWRATAFGLYGYMNFMKSGFLEHAKKFMPEDMQVQMEGKNCIVTGANSGIGFATAEGLASRCLSSHFLYSYGVSTERSIKQVYFVQVSLTAVILNVSSGATVYMVCHNKERGEAALTKIHSTTGNKNVYLEVCDVSSVSDVKSFASRFCSKDAPVHVLVNNAGLLETNRVMTPEGYELNFATNVLGTYTLTELMLPLLEKAAPDARVVTVSSGGMYTAPLTTDLQFSGNTFDGVEQYARNKRVQVALTEKWAEMYNKGVGFYSMHPGWAETPGVTNSLPEFSIKFEGKLRSSEEGADTVIWLALQPKEKLVSGGFYFDRTEAPKHLVLTGTKNTHSAIDSIIEKLRSFAGLPAHIL